MQDSLAKDQFIDSLPKEDMRLKIRQSRPKSLRDAIELALELEAFQLVSRQRVKMIRGAAVESPTQTEVSTDDKMCKQMMQCMQQCMEAMLNHTTEEYRSEGKKDPTWPWRKERVEILGLWAARTPPARLPQAACGQRPFPSKFYYCTVGKQQLAGLAGQSLARETLDVPIKVCKKDSSLGLSAFGSIAGVDCTLMIDTGSDITIVRPDVLLKSGTRLEPLAGHIEHRAGTSHSNADSLSRRPCLGDMCRHCEQLGATSNLECLNTVTDQEPRSRQAIRDTLGSIHSKEE